MRRFLLYVALIVFSIGILFPFCWMILTSLKSLGETLAIPPVIIPEKLLFSNYVVAFKQAPYLIYTFNSIVVALMTTVFMLITTVLAAFVFAKFEFKYKKVILSILLATLMIPGEMLIITNFQTIAALKLIDTRAALVLPFVSSVFYIYMVTQFFMTIPNELYLAAKVDGTSDFKFLVKILVPISKPILVTVALLNIIGSWNSYLWPTLVTNSPLKRTLPFGLMQYQSEAGTNFHYLMAATTVVILPMLILFIITRRHVIGGLTKGAIKG